MAEWEEEQGIRAGPLTASLVLIFIACFLTQVALGSDSWASMTAEYRYSNEEITAAEEFGYVLEDRSTTTSFGLRDAVMTHSFFGDDVQIEWSLETIAQEEMVDAGADEMDWPAWEGAGSTTSMALWTGFSVAVIGGILALIGALRYNDRALSGAILFSAAAAAMITAGWLNWIIFGGGLNDGAELREQGWDTTGFGISSGFIFCITAGMMSLAVPFLLAWSQLLPLDRLSPFKGVFQDLDMRSHSPTGRLNAMISASLVAIMLLSFVSQGVTSTLLSPEPIGQSASSDDDPDDEDDPFVEFWGVGNTWQYAPFALDEEVSLSGDETYSVEYDTTFEYVGRLYWEVSCEDDTGEVSDQNLNEQVDTIEMLITADNGQDLSIQIDCDGDLNGGEIIHDRQSDLDDWYDQFWPESGQPGVFFHSEENITKAIDDAPKLGDFFPLTIEFTAEANGDTLGQNNDDSLLLKIGHVQAEGFAPKAYLVYSGQHSSYDHVHYQS